MIDEEIEKEWEVIIRGRTLKVQVTLTDFEIGNSGIGAYEYWGAKGYDHGYDFVESWDTVRLVAWSGRRVGFVDISPKLAEEIKTKLCEDEKFCQEVENELWDIVSEYNNQDYQEYNDEEYD